MNYTEVVLLSAMPVDAVRWTGGSAASDPDAIRSALAVLHDIYAIEPGPRIESSATHLDTADWRLLGAGLTLSHVDRRTLALHGAEGVLEQPTGPVRWPALPETIDPGPVLAAISEPVWIRALLPVARTRSATRIIAVLNADQKTVARLEWREVSVNDPVQRELPPRIAVRAVRGYEKEAEQVIGLLLSSGQFDPLRSTEIAELRLVAGLGSVASPAPVTTRDQPADHAIAVALQGFWTEVIANLPGTIADVDTEFLHDLRVAVRRTRSVLKLLGDVLAEGTVERFADEFRWLGDVTTPTRDLDVYLLDIDRLAAAVSTPESLSAFADHLRQRRRQARTELVRSLRSPRVADLDTDWTAALTAALQRSEPGAPTAGDLADQRLHAIYRKVAKRARAIDEQSPSEDVHTLRKRCKELRYLLEVFRPLCRPEMHKLIIKDLKKLQDVLGEFQDGEVQAAGLREYAQQMIDGGEHRAAVLLAMGELSAQFEARQRRARSELDAHHDEYLGARTAKRLDELVANQRDTPIA